MAKPLKDECIRCVFWKGNRELKIMFNWGLCGYPIKEKLLDDEGIKGDNIQTMADFGCNRFGPMLDKAVIARKKLRLVK